ncbi:MAG TPA: hypothetical protein PK559_06455 [Ignavibacteriaceae bacterium]|nr:hypothetical protein [Ignavibacteriaceae bacterium]
MKSKFRNINYRNLVTPILISLILFHSEFHFILFKSLEVKYKREIKTLIKSGIPEDKLIEFVFHKSIVDKEIKNFKWVKNYEFRYEGEMYDIIRTKVIGDSIYYSCFHDLKESALFSNLHKHLLDFISTNKANKKEILNIIHDYSKYYVSHDISFLTVFSAIQFSTINYFNIKPKIFEIISPPPNA